MFETSTILDMETFELIVAGAVLVVMLLFGVVLVYLILILRAIRAFFGKVRKGEAFIEKFGELLAEKVMSIVRRGGNKRD